MGSRHFLLATLLVAVVPIPSSSQAQQPSSRPGKVSDAAKGGAASAAEELRVMTRVRELAAASGADSSARAAERRRLLRQFVARPLHADGGLLAEACMNLFTVARTSPLPSAELVRVASCLERHVPPLPSGIRLSAALMLADSGAGLASAERLARSVLADAPADARRQVALVGRISLRDSTAHPPGIDSVLYQGFLERAAAPAHDALGWIEAARGHLDPARHELAAAAEGDPFEPLSNYHMGRVVERAGNLMAAQEWYARGYILEGVQFGLPPLVLVPHGYDEPALRRVYRARRGSSAGYDSLLARLEIQRQRISAGRGAALPASMPEVRSGPLPPFRLPRLDGDAVSSDTLRGRIGVIDFWEIWCKRCVAGMPALQKFFEKYRNDPDVVFLTIDSGDSAQALRRFVAERKLDFPVLLGSAFAESLDFAGNPTTWVVDRSGRPTFRVSEADPFAELVRLVELVRAQPAAKRGAAQSGASAAAQRLRTLYFLHDYDGAVAEGRELGHALAADPEMRAWYLGSLAQEALSGDAAKSPPGPTDRAPAAADSLLRVHPSGPWGHLARALALAPRYGVPANAAVAPAARARAAAPGDPDTWWLYAAALSRAQQTVRALAVVDSAIARFGVSAPLLREKGRAEWQRAYTEAGTDTMALTRAAATLDEAIRRDSLAVDALLDRGTLSDRRGEPGRGYLLHRRAAEISPHAVDVHESYWNDVQRRRDRTEPEKRDEIVADAERMLRARPDNPSTMRAVAGAYDDLRLTGRRDSLEAQLLARFPGSAAAERLLMERIYRLGSAIRRREVADSATAKEAYRRMLRAFVARAVHLSRERLAGACTSLFLDIAKDTMVTAAELAKVARGAAENRSEPGIAFATVPAALADRHVALPLAERLALQAPARLLEFIEGRRSYYTPEKFEQYRKVSLSEAHDVLGWVYLAQGKRAAAERELNAALALDPRSVDAPYHMGRLEEGRGRVAAAEKVYGRGYAAERRQREHPNEDALRRLYRARHDSLAGYEAYIADLQEKARAKRRDAVLAHRLRSPRPMPAFSLERLGGGSFPSDSLRGKIAVVNFWGVWCSPCVAETPQMQKLHERFRADPDVVLVTIDTNEPASTVREFMEKRKFDFPVLLDDGFVARAGVSAFPTTWFVGRDGRITYQVLGGSDGDTLIEDYVWRIEALRGGTAALKAAPRP